MGFSFPASSRMFNARILSFSSVLVCLLLLITVNHDFSDTQPDLCTRFREKDRKAFDRVLNIMNDADTQFSLNRLSWLLEKYYGKQVVVLLDEYGTPMREAWVKGYWDELSGFIRGLFHAMFKTNRHLERAVITGITQTSRESVFSDLNNLKVVTTISGKKYETVFGFTENAVLSALEEFGLSEEKQRVKVWYDGFTSEKCPHMYNPWSILNFLDE